MKSRSKNIKSRPEWQSDIDNSRKQSINSDISTVNLQETDRQTFKTIKTNTMREPSKPSNNNRSSSLPSIKMKSPSKPAPEDYSYLDKYKPPPQYMTNRERMELLRLKQEKERNNNNVKYESTKKVYQAPPQPIPKHESQRSPKKTVKSSPKKSSNNNQSDSNSRPDPSKIYSVPSKKVKPSDSRLAPKSKSEPTSKASSRNSSTSNSSFSDLGNMKSATHSAVSNVSNFNLRTKVIGFNDKKQSLGSLGMASITKLENNFKVRQFPDGGRQGLSNSVKLIESEDWEKNVEGLEMMASLAKQHPDVLESEAKMIRNIMLKSVKNLRSQVCRAAVQAVAVVFLHVGKTLETDSDNLIKELLQKSADTNKFIRLKPFIEKLKKMKISFFFRSDSKKALDVMAENFSVYKVISLIIVNFSAQKNVAIRANIADIVDSVIVR